MLLCLHRTEKDLHRKLTGRNIENMSIEQIEQMFGLDTQTEVDKPTSRKPGRHNKDNGSHGNGRQLAGLTAKRLEAQAQKSKERQKMIHSYRDRLLPRFHAD